MRELTDHHDGHGLNELIRIEADEPDQSGASHHYVMRRTDVENGTGASVADLQFQKGPRHVAGNTPGIVEAALLVVLMDRLRGFQAGPYSSRENAIILTKLEECLLWTKHRADQRAKRGVLGTNTK